MSESDILLRSAQMWKELEKYRYKITFGFKQKLYVIDLGFMDEEFRHLAGFSHLEDLPSVRLSSRNTLKRILSRKLTVEHLKKSCYYQEIEPRLKALSRLKEILENDFKLFEFDYKQVEGSTKIRADFLISAKAENVEYVFLVKETEHSKTEYQCCCRSIFEKGERDYEHNQSKRTILKKERVDTEKGDSLVFFDIIKPVTNN